MPRPLTQVQAQLTTIGLTSILHKMLDNQITEPIEMPFASYPTAKRTMTLLYEWLSYYPLVKERIGLRLSKDTGMLTIIPKSAPERRGQRRKGI